MILDFGEEEREALLKSIEMLRILKHLQLLGYTIPPMQFTTTNDDMLSDLEDIGVKVIGIVTDKKFKIDYVLPSKYDVTSMDDDDGYLITEILIYDDVLVKYLKMTKNLPEQFFNITRNMLSKQYMWYEDYSIYDVFVPDENNGLLILCTDFMFFDSYFVEKLVELINFCKIELDSRHITSGLYVEKIKSNRLKNKRRRKNRKKKNRRR